MMKLATSLVLVLFATAGCDKKEEESTVKKADPNAPKVTEPVKKDEPAAPTPLSGTALADKYKACNALVNAGSFDQFRTDCVDASYTGHAYGGMPQIKGADGLVAWLEDMKTAMPDWKLQPQLILVSGRDVLAVNLMTGTHTGPLKTAAGELAATNKKVGALMFHRIQLNDANKVTDEWALGDALTLMGQLGQAPKGMVTRAPLEKGLDGAPIVVVSTDDAKERANFEAVKKTNEAFIANKPADVVATMADDVVYMDQTSDKDVKGKKDVEKGLAMFRGGWSNVKLDGVQMWGGGDYVIQSMKFAGTNDKDMGAMKKTGKAVAADVVEILHFKDGKVDQMWRFGNRLDMAMQLGLVPAPEPAKK